MEKAIDNFLFAKHILEQKLVLRDYKLVNLARTDVENLDILFLSSVVSMESCQVVHSFYPGCV